MRHRPYSIPIYMGCIITIQIALTQLGSSLPYINQLLPMVSVSILWILLALSTYTHPLIRSMIAFGVFITWMLGDSHSLLEAVVMFVWVFPPSGYAVLKQTIGISLSFVNKIPYRYKLLLILIGVTAYSYYPSLQSYFEGDEWVFFRYYAPEVMDPWWFVRGFINTFTDPKIISLHTTPLSYMLFVIQYRLFGLSFTPYIIFSVVTHILTSLTLAYFVQLVTKNRTLATVSAIVFAGLSTHAQAITWTNTNIYTQLSVLTGLWSLISLKKLKTHAVVAHFKPMLLIVVAMWFKETAIIFVPLLIIMARRQGRLKQILPGLAISVAILAGSFALVQANSPISSDTSPSSSHQLLDLLTSDDMNMHLFYLITIPLKTFSQTLIDHTTITDLSVYITDHHFPYFNQEKAIRGTTYLSFIQAVMPEMVSYALTGFLLLLGTSINPKFKLYKKLALTGWIVGTLPIFALILKIPWWGYTSFIDSRHLYHLTPFMALFAALVILSLAQSFADKTKTKASDVVAVIVVALLWIYTTKTHQFITTMQEDMDFTDRKHIIETLQTDVDPVPDKLVLYTESNKSYYGFANWMLPFPIPFTHIMPVIFHEAYHPGGIHYPAYFTGSEYLQENKEGLIAQDYKEVDGYGLGYYLDYPRMIKAIEKNSLDPEVIVAYRYDGDEHTFTNITDEIRQRVVSTLADRQVFKDWIEVSDTFEKAVLHISPTSTIVNQDSRHTIYDNGLPILTMTEIPNVSGQVFTEFVSSELDSVVSLENAKSFTIQPDFDTPRLVYSALNEPNIWYTYAGNNDAFYKLELHNPDAAMLLLRTVEYIDAPNEALLVKGVEGTI